MLKSSLNPKIFYASFRPYITAYLKLGAWYYFLSERIATITSLGTLSLIATHPV